MKILLSGASGSFGSELIRHLNNFDVDTISLRYGVPEKSQMAKLSTCDVFVHLGALLNGKFNDLFNSNVLITKNILDYLGEQNPQAHFIYFSSMSVLKKNANTLPFDYLNHLQMSDYALSKYLSELICSRYKHIISHMNVVRFSTLFYENPEKDGLSKLVYDAVRNKKIVIYNAGVAKRDFMPLDIAAQYIAELIRKKALFGETLNIVSGKETSFREIANFLDTKINDLIIEDTTDASIIDRVASNFSSESIKRIGEISFNLFDRISSYIEELSKPNALSDRR